MFLLLYYSRNSTYPFFLDVFFSFLFDVFNNKEKKGIKLKKIEILYVKFKKDDDINILKIKHKLNKQAPKWNIKYTKNKDSYYGDYYNLYFSV